MHSQDAEYPDAPKSVERYDPVGQSNTRALLKVGAVVVQTGRDMRCLGCGSDNPGQARFCQACGAPLVWRCAGCGTQLAPTAKFCGECGRAVTTDLPVVPSSTTRFSSPSAYTPRYLADRILTSQTALEGERKQVTVLFADLQGSMQLLVERDPEEARELLDPSWSS